MEESKYCTRINEKTDEVLLAIKKSAKKISDIVAQTAGPYGHNVMLINGKQCRITKDGISVLRYITEPESESDYIALSVIRSASEETNRLAGDGTTATCILANEIFNQGYNYLTAGMNGNMLRNGIVKASELAQKMVKESLATPVKADDIYNVAKISANGSDEIAKILTDAFKAVGNNGTVKVETSNAYATTSRVVHGMTFDQGYESAYFINNTHGECVLDDPIILIINKRLTVLGELLEPFSALMRLNKPILVIADGYERDIINTFAVNKMKGFPICVVSAPSYNPYKTQMMEDIAVVTGGKVISPETGLSLNSILKSTGQVNPQTGTPMYGVDNTIIGRADKVIVTENSTSIVTKTGAINQERYEKRMEEINQALAAEDLNDHDKKILDTRKARLGSGIAIISVGGATDAEMNEKKDLVDDAFASVSSSQKKGIVPGSGLTYLAVHDALLGWLVEHQKELNKEEMAGFQVFAESLTKPFLAICGNANGQNAQFLLGCIQNANRAKHAKDTELKPWTDGIDLGTGDGIDVIEKGIIDSAAAVIETMKNGASAGAQLLSLSGVVNTPLKPVPAPRNDDM